jgi:molybdopterin synthase sulfur carrier subunit
MAQQGEVVAVEVRYFASLRERFERARQRVEVPVGATVAAVWSAATGEPALPVNVRAARNHEYVDRSEIVEAGDEIAFFPPVTGG